MSISQWQKLLGNRLNYSTEVKSTSIYSYKYELVRQSQIVQSAMYSCKNSHTVPNPCQVHSQFVFTLVPRGLSPYRICI